MGWELTGNSHLCFASASDVSKWLLQPFPSPFSPLPYLLKAKILTLNPFVNSLNLSPGLHKAHSAHSVGHTGINALSLWSSREESWPGSEELGKENPRTCFSYKMLFRCEVLGDLKQVMLTHHRKPWCFPRGYSPSTIDMH